MATTRSLAFNPDSFLSFAGTILKDPSADEVTMRTAMSRAYYSVFLNARDHLFGHDARFLTKKVKSEINSKYKIISGKKRELGSHEIVSFAIKFKTGNITLSDQLDKLRRARINADYNMNADCLVIESKTSWRVYAEETCQLASQLLPRIRRLPNY
jgi:hypothetical protein